MIIPSVAQKGFADDVTILDHVLEVSYLLLFFFQFFLRIENMDRNNCQRLYDKI